MVTKEKVKLTPEKFKQLNNELDELMTIGRKVIANKLNEYRNDSNTIEDGAAYNDVIEEKRQIEDRIMEISKILENSEISTMACDLSKVAVGCSVTVDRNGCEHTFVLVPSLDADPAKGKISDESPIGQALIGKKVGEKVVVDTPEAKCDCKVLAISAPPKD